MTQLVITFIADILPESLIREVASALEAEQITWLKEGQACDFYFEKAPNWQSIPPSIIHRLSSIDTVLQPAAKRKKRLLISDMDSTMITVECIDELADFVGKKAEISAITERAMNGELDFEAALRERMALLKGLPESVLEQCYRERVKLMPGAKELVQTMRAKSFEEGGAHCVLVSGGFTFFTSKVAAELGFHEHFGNVLEVENGQLTGRVLAPILGSQAKLAKMLEICKKLDITPADVLAIGDGANDLPMLLAAGLGVAYHAKPSVQAQAAHRINHNNLKALLYAQGYHV